MTTDLPSPSGAPSVNPRAFVTRSTRLVPVPGAEWIRLHLTDDTMALWQATRALTGDPDQPIPFWSVAWGGGLALVRYLREHPEVVAGRRVLDLGSGSGLCAIAAREAGAADVSAVDIDPFAIAAIGLNARANRQRLTIVAADLLDDEPPEVDLVLAGDCWYEEPLASRATRWLRRASDAGSLVLLGDPGRRHLPLDGLRLLASYEIRSSSDIEDAERTRASVHGFAAGPRAG